MASTISDDLRAGALVYHRSPKPGKLEIQPTKPLGNQRDLALAYSPGVAAACEAIVADPAAGRRTDRARQPRGGGLQRHRGARPRQYRPARRQAGDGRQGGPVQEIRRHRRVRHRDRRARRRPRRRRSWRRWSRPSAASISRTSRRRNASTSRTQLKARMKIPVFHDDQHGTAIIVARGGAERAASDRQEDRRGQDRRVRRGRGGARLPQSAGRARRQAREHLGHRSSRASSTRAAPTLMDRWKAVYAQKTDKRTLGEVIDGADIFLGLSAPRRAQARDGQAHGGAAADHGARQSDAGNHAGGGARGAPRRDDLHRALGLSEPGQQRPVLSLHLPRRARCRRDHHQRGDEARGRRGDRGARARGAVGRRGARLRRRGAHLRHGLADPQPVRSAPDPAHRAGGRARRRWTPASRPARSPISTPIRSGSTASCSAPASS